MRWKVRLSCFIAASALLCGAAQAQQLGIRNTPHNLSSGFATDPDRNEICVYCHTPHGAEIGVEAPLWNKSTTGSSYQTYDSTTIKGDVLEVSSVSIACLTCHDGTQAMDSVINGPGSGRYNPDGARMGSLAGSGLITNTIARIGTDLRNDHPIGIQYGGFDLGGGPIDPDFKTSGSGLETAQINGAPRWWVDTEAVTAGVRDKRDMILYTRDNSGVLQPFVECASCHDPHGVENDMFLRISNANSGVCLACHVK